MLMMNHSKSLRNELVNGLPNGFGRETVKYFLGAFIEQDHPLLLIHRNDGIHRRIEYAAYPGLLLLLQLFHLLLLGEINERHADIRFSMYTAYVFKETSQANKYVGVIVL